MKDIRIFLLAFCSILGTGLHATTYTFISASGRYNVSTSWLDQVQPPDTLGMEDTIIISFAKACYINQDIVNHGVIISHGAIRLQDNSIFTNFGYIESPDYGIDLYDASVFVNHGIMRNISYVTCSETSLFENTGVLEVIDYFSFQVDATFVNTGTLEGSLSFIYSLEAGSGVIAPGPQIGRIKVYGDYHQDYATYQAEIGGDHFNDTIVVDGTAYLSGYLNVAVTDLYVPDKTTCSEFVIMTYGSLQGEFYSVELPSTSFHDWHLEYRTHSLVVVATIKSGETHALAFDGVNDYVNIDGPIGIMPTIEFRFFPLAVNPAQAGDMIISLNESATMYIHTMATSSSYAGETLTIVGSGGALYVTYPFERRWYHIAITGYYDGSVYRYGYVFVDGVIQQASYYGSPPEIFSSNSLRLGSRKTYPQGYVQDFFHGRLDELRIWNFARHFSEIAANHDQELSPQDTNNLSLYYKMNQGIAYGDNTCIDRLINEMQTGENAILHQFDLSGGGTSNLVKAEACPEEALTPNIFNATTGDWFNSDNWSLNVIPNTCHSVIIPSGREVIIDQGNAQCFSLSVDPMGKFDLNGNSAEIEVFAPWK